MKMQLNELVFSNTELGKRKRKLGYVWVGKKSGTEIKFAGCIDTKRQARKLIKILQTTDWRS